LNNWPDNTFSKIINNNFINENNEIINVNNVIENINVNNNNENIKSINVNNNNNEININIVKKKTINDNNENKKIENNGINYIYQDIYKVDKKLNKKFNNIKNMLDYNKIENFYYFNFLSGNHIYFNLKLKNKIGTNGNGFLGHGYPKSIAKKINLRVLNYLKNLNNNKILGILIMDFPLDELINLIILFNNFN
jgi:hypothetical protein